MNSMRVRFFAPDSELEATRYVEVIAEIDRFWQYFHELARKPPVEWLGDARARLSRVSPRLGLEVRGAGDGIQILYVVPLDGAATAPLAELCIQRAPTVMPWLFEISRPAQTLNAALSAVKDDFGYELSEARARVGVARGHLLEVVLASHHFHGAEDEVGRDAAETLIARLLGDAVFEDWIGAVSIQGARRPSLLSVVGEGVHELPLRIDEVTRAVEAARDGIVSGLSVQPFHAFCERAEWTMLEVNPIEREALELRISDVVVSRYGAANDVRELLIESPLAETAPDADLFLASSICPEALKCFLSGLPFSSRRFSRHGECFCYLQLRLEAENDQARLDRRAELEEQLNRALVPGRLGCVIGSGMGSEYTYVHLALLNVEACLDLLERRLRRFGVKEDAWLLFCDDQWQHEWVALGEDRRPPPR